jgi:hypothetical protein
VDHAGVHRESHKTEQDDEADGGQHGDNASPRR